MTPDRVKSIENSIRPDLLALGGYSAHKSPDTLSEAVIEQGVIKLDANENPYGCSPAVLKAFANYSNWYTYPDAGQARLREQLQKYVGIGAEYIVAANGSGELLDYILCLLLEPGDEVINCIPTFDLFRFRTLVNRGRLVNVTREEDYGIDVKKIKAAMSPKTKIIIVANPNSPTGNIIPQRDILELVDTGLPLLVDEAYYEFCGETVVPLVKKCKNLMVLRTFSKWAGLAGLRLGYGILPTQIADFLMKIKMPYNVNVAALVAAEATLNDASYAMDKVKAIIAEKSRLFGELKKLTWLKPYPSRANFIFCTVLKGDAREIWQKLQNRGILVRYFDQPLLRNSFRISVGKPEHTDILIEALKELGEEISG